jgi:type IV pilus assembly protein PilV
MKMQMKVRMPRIARRQGGSTMIEVMVAILVLALGMMGMLGMFVSSLKITSGAIYRNVATQQAYAIADTMRANLPNLAAYFTPTATANAGCFNSTGCTAAQVPNAEYKMWQTQLGTLLPAGQGKVCRDNAASNASRTPAPQTYAAFFTCSDSGPVVVKVCWDETRIQNSNASAANSAGSGGNTSTGGISCLYTNL